MKLFIVESPAKAKTIGKYLGEEYKVLSSVGHVRDLPKSNKKAIDIEAGFVPHYEVDPKKYNVIKELKEYGKKATQVILATDPDREGEAIAWHLQDECKFKNSVRVTYHEITKPAILEALQHPRTIDMHLKEAQEARRVLDRLVGYDLSGVIWKKVRYGLSAGRVQSPALRILAEREREILAFKPVPYFVLHGDFLHQPPGQAGGLIPLPGRGQISAESKDIFDISRIVLEKEVNESKSTDFLVRDKKVSIVNRSPRGPFTTSTLQQTASSRLGMAPQRTMRAAQKLYEAGLITYMRTDSTNISPDAAKNVLAFVEKKYGGNYAFARTYKNKSKNAQEAHEAIRPTDINILSTKIGKDESMLYDLIWARTVASQMSDAKTERTHIEIGSDKLTERLMLDGSRITYDGWLKADPDGAGEDVILPKIEIGDRMELQKLEIVDKETKPPNRFSEAGLIKELEARGIGRPSTYASIISTIQTREYVTLENKALKPTDTGMVVSDFLENNFMQYISDDFTAEMENSLDEIAEGKKEYVKVLKEFYGPFLALVKEKTKGDKATDLGEAPENIKCPICGKSMVVKLARNGKFYSCSDFPTCLGALTLEGKEMAAAKDLGKLCPKCGKHNLIEREGKFGMFVACSGYPKCKYIEQAEKVRPADAITCPTCKTGYMEERRGRFGIFYSCSNYPDCKNAIKTKPTGNICKLCGSLMMTGTKTIPERCSKKECPMHRPDKMETK
jgi:DNA topoisomerase-1